MTVLRAFTVCLALLASAGFATAQQTQVSFGGLRADPTLPVEVTAETLDVDQETGEAIFQGDVLIAQGDMKLSAPRVRVVYDSETSQIARMEATGGVTLVSGTDAAEAQRADYTIDDGVIVMTGDVLLTQGPSAITAERMTVNLTTGSAQMTGRVRTILRSDDN